MHDLKAPCFWAQQLQSLLMWPLLSPRTPYGGCHVRQHQLKTTRRGLFVTVVFALLAAVGGFAFLWFVTGGFFIAIVAAAILIAVLGSFHYLLWGRTMVGHAPEVYSRPRVESDLVPDSISLPLDESERVELIRLLDRSLADPNGQAPEARALLQRLRERLERYGA